MANDYFKCMLPFNEPIENIERSAKHLQNTVYQYFKTNFGNDLDTADILHEQYGALSKNKLKKALKKLKESRVAVGEEIEYVSKLLRLKFKSKKVDKRDDYVEGAGYDMKLKQNFWKFCKRNIESNDTKKTPLLVRRLAIVILNMILQRNAGIEVSHSLHG